MLIARTIEFNVDVDGITPQGEQYGGLQGEHQATELVFNFSQELLERTEDSFDGEALIITLQCTDGAGGYHEYEISNTDFGSTKKFYIPREITQAGGLANFCLVWSDVFWEGGNNEKTQSEGILYSFPFKLRFKDTLTVGTPSQQEYLEDGASILEGAKQYANETKNYRDDTQDLLKNAITTLDALDNSIAEGQQLTRELDETIKDGTNLKTDLSQLLGNTNTVIEGLNGIDDALERIIALQEEYIGGGAQ